MTKLSLIKMVLRFVWDLLSQESVVESGENDKRQLELGIKKLESELRERAEAHLHSVQTVCYPPQPLTWSYVFHCTKKCEACS